MSQALPAVREKALRLALDHLDKYPVPLMPPAQAIGPMVDVHPESLPAVDPERPSESG